MSSQVLTVEADSLEAAREEARSKLPANAYLFSEMIISDGKEESIEAIAETVEHALAQARQQVPRDTEVAREIMRISPSECTIRVEATDAQNAINQMKARSSNTATLLDIELVSEAKKGFLGLGARPNVYQGRVRQPAVVEVVFRKKAVLKVDAGDLPTTGFCQFCGKKGARQYVGVETSLGHYDENATRFYCGRSSLMSFCKSRMEKLEMESSISKDIGELTELGSAMAFDAAMKGDQKGMSDVLNALPSHPDTGSTKVYCWSCGKSLATLTRVCQHCGRRQTIKRL